MNSIVNTKKELIDLIVANSEKIGQFGVQRIGIFGSFVRDEAKPGSDIDFFVDIKSEMKTFGKFFELGEFLENLTGRKVELITPQSLSKYIGPHILKEVEYVNFAA
jgi:predicted nucleotidyltransferase